MKRLNNLYDETYKLYNIVKMTDKVLTRVKNKDKVAKFELYKSEHILNIKRRLENGYKDIGKYNVFMITDSKCRIVMGQDIEDKIINHLIAEYILNKVFENKYTNFMCATRRGKGTLYGVLLTKKYLNYMKRKYDNFFILKLDISKYFYSMDHDVLKGILKRKIKDEKALNVLFRIIDSTDSDYINSEINRLKKKRIEYLNNSNLNNKYELIREVREIPLYEKGKGVNIGAQVSQSFGLIYLYEIIHFIKEDLKIKCVVNYMDDIICIHENKNYLRVCLDKIIDKLYEYKLKLNPYKIRIDSFKNGIDFLGYRFLFKNNKVILKVRIRVKNNFKKKIKAINILFKYNYINKNEYINLMCSYNGILKWGDCRGLYYKYKLNNCDL